MLSLCVRCQASRIIFSSETRDSCWFCKELQASVRMQTHKKADLTSEESSVHTVAKALLTLCNFLRAKKSADVTFVESQQKRESPNLIPVWM